MHFSSRSLPGSSVRMVIGLVERTNNTKGGDDDDVVMTFAVDSLGHKKRLRPAYWVHMVRTCSAGVSSVYYKDSIAAIDKLHTPSRPQCYEDDYVQWNLRA